MIRNKDAFSRLASIDLSALNPKNKDKAEPKEEHPEDATENGKAPAGLYKDTFSYAILEWKFIFF